MRAFLYIFGYLILICGLAWGAIELGVPALYVQIGAVILLGLGIIGAASRPRAARVVTAPPAAVVTDRDSL